MTDKDPKKNATPPKPRSIFRRVAGYGIFAAAIVALGTPATLENRRMNRVSATTTFEDAVAAGASAKEAQWLGFCRGLMAQAEAKGLRHSRVGVCMKDMVKLKEAQGPKAIRKRMEDEAVKATTLAP